MRIDIVYTLYFYLSRVLRVLLLLIYEYSSLLFTYHSKQDHSKLKICEFVVFLVI